MRNLLTAILFLFLLVSVANAQKGSYKMPISPWGGTGVTFPDDKPTCDPASTATVGDFLAYDDTNDCVDWAAPPGAAGGDNVSVNGGATVDPDFTSTGSELTLVNTTNVITFLVKDDVLPPRS
jgi:hypothetical protein